MPSLADVFRVLVQMRDEEVVTAYAIGGATAVLFYAEPVRTYALDVFAILPGASESGLISVESVYAWAKNHGYAVDAEHIIVHGVPVQIVPAYNQFVVERKRQWHLRQAQLPLVEKVSHSASAATRRTASRGTASTAEVVGTPLGYRAIVVNPQRGHCDGRACVDERLIG